MYYIIYWLNQNLKALPTLQTKSFSLLPIILF
jgi:hypothetical protein